MSDDAAHFAGREVEVRSRLRAGERHRQARHRDRRRHTHAELPQDGPNRATVMTASFLQASLFTSVVAFGVARSWR